MGLNYLGILAFFVPAVSFLVLGEEKRAPKTRNEKPVETRDDE